MNLNFVLAFQNAAFFRNHFDEKSAVSDYHYEFTGGRPKGGRPNFKKLILASFDPDSVDDETRSYLREVVDHLALGAAGHAHGESKKLQKFSNVNQKKSTRKNHQERNRMKKNQKRARKFFSKHHRRN